MDERWPQRARFLELVEEWMSCNKKTSQDFATAIGKSLASFYTYRTRSASIPTAELLIKMATVLDCDITELITNPKATVAGQSLKGLSEMEQALAHMAFGKFRDPDLTEDDRQILFQDWIRDYDRLKAMKARHLKP